MAMKDKYISFFRRLFRTYIVDALSFMAMGLFCSLILGLIVKQIAYIPGFDFLMDIAAVLQSAPVVGGSIGLAIALGLKRAPLVTISAVAVGALGYQFGRTMHIYRYRRTGGWCSYCRLLRPDDRLCCHKLQG